ncbi:dihydrolipoamide dehydrogenase [Devosia chinhatensis]|uniref:Dihydrolipoamide dehydrogenase n=1 Tax=Devosia chinhatensis TaxID=429727 RepID=A0A0F5FPR4_9HYPH|nr:dihydrolipoamide dehydrogenase [Devosia chinhatensis]
MFDLSCDVAVIGAGTAGLGAARRALREGAKVLLIDDKFAGTMCANVGCMPSKLLIAASKAADHARRGALFGVRVSDVSIDGKAVMQRVRDERDRFAASTRKSFEDFPEGTLIKARARFTAPGELALDDGRTIKAKAIVVATGGTPKIPEAFSGLGDLCFTHETIFELPDLPKSMAVIGAGPIGLELAQAFARLGVKVSLFDDSETLGGVDDPHLQAMIQDTLSEDMMLCLGVTSRAHRNNDQIVVTYEGKGHSASESVDILLVATGRPPQFDGLDLEKAGIACDDKGTPLYDQQTMQCGTAPIFLAGDAAADRPILHEASAEGSIAGRNAATFPKVTPTQRMIPFSMVFSQPVLARIGEEPSNDHIIARASYGDQGRAKVDGEAIGEVQIVADPSDGRLLGAILFCPGAEHMAHLFVAAISAGLTASQMLSHPFYHPTLEEGLKPALREICSRVPSSGDYDRTSAPGG